MTNEQYEFDKRIYNILLDVYRKDPDLSNYQWKEPAQNGIIQNIMKNIKEDSPAKKVTKLKLATEEKFLSLLEDQNKEEILDLAYSIIQDWGGIHRFKRNSNNDCRINNVIQIIKEPGENLSFEGISSLSKVASFFNSNDYAIYDARVAFSLNWLIFKNSLAMNLFCQPPSLNTKIISVYSYVRNEYKKENYKYYKRAKNYSIYCNLLKKTVEYGKQNFKNLSIGKLEMCLFSIADNKIIDEINSK